MKMLMTLLLMSVAGPALAQRCDDTCTQQARCDLRCWLGDPGTAARNRTWTTCGVYGTGGCCSPSWRTASVSSSAQRNWRTEWDAAVGAYDCNRYRWHYTTQLDNNNCCKNPPCGRGRCDPTWELAVPGYCSATDGSWEEPWDCDEAWSYSE